MWRLGVQCEGPVRDLVRLTALATTNPMRFMTWSGDRSQGPYAPYRTAEQPTGGSMEKNGGVTPDLG